MQTSDTYDAVIIGGGLSGLTMACRLGRAGVRVAVIDRAPLAPPATPDLRTTAISYGSRKILEDAGIWDGVAATACAIDDIRILDGDSPLLLNFLKTEAGNKTFGWIVENVDLRRAMAAVVNALPAVTYRQDTVRDFTPGKDGIGVILQGGDTLAAQLVIGADGRRSFTRDWMGVRTRQWSYNQRAVICTAAHENPHENTAVEHFWPEGPFAILPMADAPDGTHRSSVVFTEHGPEKNSLMRLDDSAFELALAARFPPGYGAVKLVGARAVYPLGLVHAAAYTAPRMALVADAAHGIHPIAGQGLNLGFRDVDALARLVTAAKQQGADIGAPGLLAEYQRRRRFDNMAMVAVTDGLNRLFSNNIPPVRFLRRTGLKLVSKLPPAKRFFMRQAMGDR